MNKICKICKLNKPYSEFYYNPKTISRLGCNCKECHRKISHDGYITKRKEMGEEKWKEKGRKNMREWRKNNLEKAREKSRFYAQKYKGKYNETRRIKFRKERIMVLNKYGGKCECCEEDDYRFLCLDHKNNNGYEHRKSPQGKQLTKWAIKNNFPKDLRVLCFNCNFARAFYGGKEKICPHKLLK